MTRIWCRPPVSCRCCDWLAESAGLYDLLEGLTVPSPKAGAKTASVVGGMLAGADSIDDLDLLRHGGMGRWIRAELDFIEQYLDVPISLLLDNTDVARVLRGSGPGRGASLTDEETKLQQLVALRRSSANKGRPFVSIGLKRPDIVAYLAADAIRMFHPLFTSWSRVLEEFDRLHTRPSFKPWLLNTHHVDLTNSGRIAQVLEVMQSEQLPPEGDLTIRVNEILANSLAT